MDLRYVVARNEATGRGELRCTLTAERLYPCGDEILVRVSAAALGYRDVMLADRPLPAGFTPVVPLCEGAGVVVDVGNAVTAFRPGDHVVGIAVQDWMSGPRQDRDADSTLGEGMDGMLANYVLLKQWGALPTPEYLSPTEAAALPFAGLTAWNALFEAGAPVKKGDSVLIHGTDDIAVSAAQFAKAIGASVVLTSAQDESKALALRELGVDAVVDYRADWGSEVKELTRGVGVSRVLDMGGEGTLTKSFEALAGGGVAVMAGGIARSGHAGVDLRRLLERGQSLHGVSGGAKDSFERMMRFIKRRKLCPLVDRVFDIEHAQDAYDYVRCCSPFGKVVIQLT